MLENNVPTLVKTSTNESAMANTGSSLVEDVVVIVIGRRVLVVVGIVLVDDEVEVVDAMPVALSSIVLVSVPVSLGVFVDDDDDDDEAKNGAFDDSLKSSEFSLSFVFIIHIPVLRNDDGYCRGCRPCVSEWRRMMLWFHRRDDDVVPVHETDVASL